MRLYVSQSVSSFIYKPQTKNSRHRLYTDLLRVPTKKSIKNSIVVKYRGRRNHLLNQEDMLDKLRDGFDLIFSSRFPFIVPEF